VKAEELLGLAGELHKALDNCCDECGRCGEAVADLGDECVCNVERYQHGAEPEKVEISLVGRVVDH